MWSCICAPGGWTAGVSEAAEARQNASAAAEQAGAAASLFTVTGTLPQLEEAREAVLVQLRKRPLALYALLRGGLPRRSSRGCCLLRRPLRRTPAAAQAARMLRLRGTSLRFAAGPLQLRARRPAARRCLPACLDHGQRNRRMIPAAQAAPPRTAGRPQRRAAKAALPSASGSPRLPQMAPCTSQALASARCRCGWRSRASLRQRRNWPRCCREYPWQQVWP